MKQTLTVFFLFLSFTLFSQPWFRKLPVAQNQNNFYQVQKQFHEFWKDKDVSEKEEENEEEGGYQQFARWENFMRERAYPSGKINNPDILITEYERTKNLRVASSIQSINPNWTFIGPPVVPAGGGGAGRVNCVAFDPVNNTTMYVGAAGGGVWKTTDGGLTWSSTTDQLASISIADIAIDPLNPNIIYVATGDGYGYEVWGNIFWGGTYTAGVMKSIDGGLTWSQSGLTYAQSQSEIVQRLIINPQNPNILLAATRNAVFRSTDGAATWTQVIAGHYYDLEFNPLNPGTVYAVNNSNVIRSFNGGISFTSVSSLLNSVGRISIALSPADTTIVYALTENGDFYRSVDGGQLFTIQPAPPVTLYGYYDCVLAVSPVNPQRALIAGYNMLMTDDGGLTWNNVANTGIGNDYVHVDNHTMAFLPGSNTTFFSGNDGGFFKTSNSGVDWTDLSNGMDIKQYYRMSSSLVDPDLMYAGAQDNGTDQLKNNVWTQVYGADGMDCLTDYNDVNTAYISYQGGNFFRTNDGGQTFSNISPGGGQWTTPIEQDPVDPNTIYIGNFELNKSTDQGNTWNIITNGFFTDDITHIAVAPGNHDYIYICSLDQIYMTPNGGSSWTNIAAGLPIASAAMTGITVSSANPLHIWVTFSGYSNGDKVYYSVNGGLAWNNVSGTLPNIPANCIVYQKNTNDELYLGTDFGVYYRNDTMSDWTAYQTGLPNVIIDDIEINYTASKVRVATYGRGIWESDLVTSTLYLVDAGVKNIVSPSGVYCQTVINPVVLIKNYGLDTLHTVDLKYKIDNGPIQTQNWIGTLAPSQSDTVFIPALSASTGLHTFTAFTDQPNSSVDANPGNDQKLVSFQVDNTTIPYPVSEGFETGTFPFPDWRLEGSASLVSIQPYGGFGNSSFSMMADCYTIANAKSYFISKQLDLTNAASYAQLDFNVAYAQYNSTYHDSLKVSVSTDCGLTWTTVYSKTGVALETAPPTTAVFAPTPTQWRAESVSLNPWIGQTQVIVRFEILSDFGNELYIDDINLYAGTVGLAEEQNTFIHITPVPFNNSLNIKIDKGELHSVDVTDVAGKIIKQDKATGKSLELKTDQLSNGVYFLQITTDKGYFVRRVVKH